MNGRAQLNIRLRDSSGQSLVEMALVCMIFFFLLFGILGVCPRSLLLQRDHSEHAGSSPMGSGECAEQQ